jgi:hypothetical protein
MSVKISFVFAFWMLLSVACTISPLESLQVLEMDNDTTSELPSATSSIVSTTEPTLEVTLNSTAAGPENEHLESAEDPTPAQQEMLKSTGAYPGFTLFAPIQSTTTYLIDMQGDVVHTWESDYRPGQSVYLLENGNLLRTASVQNPAVNAGGAGGLVQEIAWDGMVLWEYAYSSGKFRLHHDVEPMPNGNVLMIAWEVMAAEQALAAGRSPDLLKDGELWSEHIFEVAPDGTGGGKTVWEWFAWDHLVQNADPAKDNYGVPEAAPELIDLNFTSRNAVADWLHINSIDYNPLLDQVMLSVHNFNEIWIIDHSTTSAQAASHSGGASGMGGDLLYRWGSPAAYGTGTMRDTQLFGQHDAQWIEPGLPGEGNILIFNNNAGGPRGNYSTIVEITPPLKDDGSYSQEDGTAFAPKSPSWAYTADVPEDFYSQNISGMQRFPNGNTLICSGASGHFFEVTSAGEVVWEYVNTFGGPKSAVGDKQPFGVFKIRRYAENYPGLSALN